MTEETIAEYVASCLRAIESPSFDEKDWKKMVLDIIPIGIKSQINMSNEQRNAIHGSLLMSPMADVNLLCSLRYTLLSSSSSVAALGKNPMVPLWFETSEPEFLRCTDVSMRKTLSEWNDDHLKKAYLEQEFHKLIEVLLQDSFEKMMRRIHGDANIFENHGIASMYQDFQHDIDVFFGQTPNKPERCLELAKDGHRLLLALCKAFETPVPGNIFSSLEEP